jgi:hypothetical protein
VRWRDTSEADTPIAVELLNLMEVSDDELVSCVTFFDPDDIDPAIGELTARWIASGDVDHPRVIEAAQRLMEMSNRHEWDALAQHAADATLVSHRQLATGNDTIAEYVLSVQTFASLIPDMWVVLAEILACSAIGIVGRMAMKGTSTDGGAIDIPYVVLILLDGARVTRFEAFDPDQRDLALARFQELHQA